MKKLLTIFFLFNVLFAVGQEEETYDKVISVSEFEEMLKSGSVRLVNTYVKLDIEIVMKNNSRKHYGKDAKYYEKVLNDDGSLRGWKRLGIRGLKNVTTSFWNCKFDEVFFENCENLYLNYYSGTIGYINLNSCKIRALVLQDPTITDHIMIKNCVFKDNLSISSLNSNSSTYNNVVDFHCKGNISTNTEISGNYKSIKILNNTFYPYFNISETKSNELIIKDNTFILDSTLNRVRGRWRDKTYHDDDNYNASLVSIMDNDIYQLQIAKNKFIYDGYSNLLNNVYNYDFNGSTINEFTLQNENVERINFNNSNFSKSINLDSVSINKDFSAKGMELPEYNVDFSWNLLKNKLNFALTDSTTYNAQTKEELADEKLYNEYITSYKKFFSVFKNKGDLKSANACYAEMKDTETRRLKYFYTTEGGVDNYLNYKLNVFLKFFAEYGTSPITSVKISGWVILIFAFFYFFFYSEWDKINRKFLINKGEKLLSYFNSEQNLEELYSDKHKEDLSTFTQFKRHIKESKTQVPFFFMLFLKPLYWVAVLKLKGNKALYKRIEFLQGRWVDLTIGKKLLIGSFTFLTILTYGFYLIAIRSLNSLILSINTFTTLGFGDIPVIGISRYVAILEGFLGWFLLSIFSVSLISQILQN